jgi:alanyl-tRNA synthetase
MQQHTGQHIISGALWKTGKYRTLSVHMGREYTTIEIDGANISPDELETVENLSNRVICRNLPIEYIETDEIGIDRYALRKPCSVKGRIRLVSIGDFDCVGCGGLHFKTTGDVELVKCVGTETIRDHVRLIWKIGDRARRDYREKDRIIADLRSILGTREDSFADKVNTLRDSEIGLKRKNSLLISRLADMVARDLIRNQTLLSESGLGVITSVWKDEDDLLIKEVSKNLLRRKDTVMCLLNQKKDSVHWIIGCSENVAFPFEKVKTQLMALLNGKGGGRHPLWQGTGTGSAPVNRFLAEFLEIVKML